MRDFSATAVEAYAYSESNSISKAPEK